MKRLFDFVFRLMMIVIMFGVSILVTCFAYLLVKETFF